MTVELEAPFLLYWLKVSEVGEWGEREGGKGKEGRQGGVVTRTRLERVCPARLREEGDVNSPVSLGRC